jgi:outer membrane lipoprotein SlyB
VSKLSFLTQAARSLNVKRQAVSAAATRYAQIQPTRKKKNMNMPVNSITKSRPHPMLIIASAAVVVFSVTATAAVLGWIPSSIGGTAPTDAVTAPPVAAAAPGQHVAMKAPALRIAAAPVTHTQSNTGRVHHAAAACWNCGVVESMREVTSSGDGSGLGAAGGAVVGGLLGNQVGGGHGRDAMTVVGVIGGAFAGNQIEKQVKTTHSYQTTVRMSDGSRRSMAQATEPAWRNGDHVKIVDGVVTLVG